MFQIFFKEVTGMDTERKGAFVGRRPDGDNWKPTAAQAYGVSMRTMEWNNEVKNSSNPGIRSYRWPLVWSGAA
jgi:hypothetical protein